MFNKYLQALIVFIIFLILSILLFRNYVFKGFVPFPSNLLVSFYSPWKYQQWDGYPLGPNQKPIGFDNLKLFYPYRTYTTQRLQEGHLPLWNPYVFSGNVHLATYQSAVFYPLNFLYFIIPTIDAWSLLVLIQPILAGFFTYLFLKTLKLSSRTAFFGAVVFALSGWMIAWMEESLVIEHSALWLPLVLYGIQQLYSKRTTLGVFSILIGLTFSILAGFFQMTLYVGIFSVIFFFYKYFRSQKDTKVLFYFIFATVGSVLLTAIQWFPSFVDFFYSPRGIVAAPFIFETYLMKPWHLITFIAPDFWGSPGSYNYFGLEGFYHEKVIYIGIPALLLVLYSFFQKNLNEYENYFKWTGIVTLLLGFFPIGWIIYLLSIPMISAMVPSRIFFLTTFSLAVVASFGIEHLLKKDWNFSAIKKIVFIVGTILLFLWIFVLAMKYIPASQPFDPKGKYATVSLRNIVIPTILYIFCTLLFYVCGKYKKNVFVFYYLFLLLSLISSFYFAHKFLYFSERKFVYPTVTVFSKLKDLAGINRVWGYGNATIEKNMGSFYGLYSADGYDALYSQRYGELLYIQETKGKYTTQISRTDAQIRPSGENEKLYQSPFRRRILSLLGVRYILESKQGEGKDSLTTEERFPQDLFSLAWEDTNFRIWGYKEALPRAFLTTGYRVEHDPNTIVNAIFDPSFNPRQTLILESQPTLSSCTLEGNGQATIEEYLPEKVLIKTNSDCDALLFLSDTDFPGWTATIDTKSVPILRADYALRSVVVPKGEHVVEFMYRPSEVQWGIYITLSSILLVFPLFIFSKRYKS